MKRILIIVSVLMLAACSRVDYARWSEEKANKWAEDKGWIVGCDYIAASAINQIEMWQEETFDPETIDKELAMAEDLGFNTVRVFFSFLVYADDPKGFIQRFDQFLGICDKHGIKALPTFWTNGGKLHNPQLGKQPESIKGVHNSAWVMNPGTEYVNDPAKWPELEKMVKGVIKAFRKDKRVLMWCLYNEPENLRRGVISSVPLMRETFKWARECKPSQPLTAPLMLPPGSKSSSFRESTFLMENSDVLSFHSYYGPEITEKMIKLLLPYNRPIVCTEYMRRPVSTFQEIMPLFKKYNVGAINFGLTAGKCNFNFPWNKVDENGESIPWDYDEPEVWFHDIFHLDGTPYSEEEVEFIKKIIRE
ncbi:MAG: cellulase family glycosylhydrolase [Bacteroidales bacterium]|nr:cellulase family glycosylhydrolase [Bacteroidales bacterium]